MSIASCLPIPTGNLPDSISSLNYCFHEFPKIGAINCKVKLHTHPASFLWTSPLVLRVFKLVFSSPFWCKRTELVWTSKALRNSIYLVEYHRDTKAAPIFYQGTHFEEKLDKIIFQAEVMAQSINCLFCRYGNLSSATQVPCKSQAWWCSFNLSTQVKGRLKNSWDFLAS